MADEAPGVLPHEKPLPPRVDLWTGAAFLALGRAGWALGILFGLVHALFAGTALVNVLLPAVHPRMGTAFSAADSAPLLEPPGFMLLNYGRETPLVTILAHLAYGGIVGWFIGGAG